MALMLVAGVPTFLLTKTILTDLGVIFLAIHERFRLARAALWGAAAVYAVLLAYHALLISRTV
jgi:hypothetical protein